MTGSIRPEPSRGGSGPYEAMFRGHASVMLLMHPETLDILDANRAAESFYGWPLEELSRMNFRSICQDGPDCHRQVVEQCCLAGCRVAVCRHLLSDGQVRDVDIRISRITVPGSDVLFAVVSDITAIVRDGRALRESEARLRSIYENTLEGMFQSSMDGRFLWANPALARMLGYSSPEELVRCMTDIGGQLYWNQADRQRLVAILREKGFVDRTEVRVRRRDGSQMWISGSSWLVKDESGRNVRIEGVLDDITARKRAESERMLLATAVEQAVEGMAILGGDWVVEYANPAFAGILGRGKPELMGAAFFGLFEAAIPERDVRQALQEGRDWIGPIRNAGPGGAILLEAVFSPIRDEAGRVTNVVALLRDVTRVKRLEKRLRLAQKLEAVGTLAGGIAHDFNNILTPILLNAEVGMQLLEEGHPPRGPLLEIVSAGGRARQLIRQIVAFSRRGDLGAARTGLSGIVSEALGLVRSTLAPDVELRFVDASPDMEVMADPGILHQVVVNLAENALHAMRQGGGRLTVSLSRQDIPGGDGAHGLAPGTYAMLTVRDTGHGMDKNLMERIFTPFFTTKKPGEGTGMGLSTVYGAVRSLGGDVRVESELGLGTRFDVLLPVAGPERPGSRVGEGRRALVVDVPAFCRSALAMALGELGFKVTAMRDPARALKAFARAPRLFDAVLAGEDLAGTPGEEFLAACRVARPGVRLVLLVDGEGGRSGSADAVLQRPASPGALAQALSPPGRDQG